MKYILMLAMMILQCVTANAQKTYTGDELPSEGLYDYTSYVTNPDFSTTTMSSGAPTGWTWTGSSSYSKISTGAKGDGVIAETQPHWQVWNGTGTMSQTVTGLPNGTYYLTCTVVTTSSDNKVIAGSASVACVNGSYYYCVKAEVTDGTLTIGIQKDNNATVELDDVELYGTVNPKGDIDESTIDLIMFMGQSNMAGRGITTTDHPEDAPTVTTGAGYEFRAITDPTTLYPITKTLGVNENVSGAIDDGTKKTGGLVPAFVNSYFDQTSTPVIAVSASMGGTSINQWQPATAILTDAIDRLHKAQQYLAANNYTVRRTLMVWCQGETDGDNHMAGSEWKTKFRMMLDAMEAEGVEQCMLIRIGNYNGSNSSVSYTDIMKAQDEAAQTWDDVHLVSTSMAAFKEQGYMKDDFHYYQDAYNIIGTEAGSNSASLYRSVRSDGELNVSREADATAFPLLNGLEAATIVYDETNEHSVVGIAANCLSNDVKLLSQQGTTPTVQSVLGTNANVIIGTVGTSTLLQTLMDSNATVSEAAEKIRGQWETFCLQTLSVDGIPTLVIMGSDPRGTAYGVFELSRRAGLSPWYWWADVNPEQTDYLSVTADGGVYGPPSVKFRGIFLNDEDWGLKPWASSLMDPTQNNIGPNTYRKVFELLLRLKANYIWPAMHECTTAFWKIDENPEVAREYDIVLGASHCEPMLRNNVYEWSRDGSGSWNWQTNSSVIRDYWATRVEESKNQDAVYTVGMRGIHDGSMPGYSSNAEKAEGLKDVIKNQRELFVEKLGKEASTVPQIFCPYKEVLTLYQIGLDLPDDITLCWADDNHGYIRQLSNPTEQKRSGGGGVYYHLSYYGAPIDYLWLSSISPSLISYEMNKAYELNCKNLWVFNVGDLKPAECEMQFAMDMAWNTPQWAPANANNYIREWAAEIFGEDVADDIEAIKRLYYRLGAEGKPEHIHSIAYTDAEIDARLADYAKLTEMVNAVESRIPSRLSDVFYELVAYPCKAADAMNRKHLYASKSFTAAKQGKREETLDYSDKATAAFAEIKTLTAQYNEQTAGGKWNGIMSWCPRSLSQFYDPSTATIADVVTDKSAIISEDTETVNKIAASEYSNTHAGAENFETIDLLGVGGQSLTVWPLQKQSYGDNVTGAPYAEYSVPVKVGNNEIAVRCLPSFPLYQGEQLRYAISIDGATPVVHDLTLTAEASPWTTYVIQGYSVGTDSYRATEEKSVNVKIYFVDPGLVVSELDITQPGDNDKTSLLQNPSFETTTGMTYDSSKSVYRGDPTGWTRTGSLVGNSYGISSDASNIDGNTICWYNSSPMPADFELSQTIAAGDIEPGDYVVRCKLVQFDGYLGNCRLFANNNVEYYGKSSDYDANIVEGELYTFAGNTALSSSTSSQKPTLSEMAVRVTIQEGESLKLGIRSSNMYADGTSATDNTGWFKVDDFRLEKYIASEEEEEEETTPTGDVTDYYIINAQFSRNSGGNGTVPTGWTWSGSTTYSKISTGVKPDGATGDDIVIPADQNHWQVWGGTGTMQQEIGPLPQGRYHLQATIVANGTGSTLFVTTTENGESKQLTTDITTQGGVYTVDFDLQESQTVIIGINKVCSIIEVDDFKLIYDGPFITANMSIGTSHWATFIAPFSVTLPSGVTAYKTESYGDGYVKLASLSSTSLDANTPVLLNCETEVNKDYTDVDQHTEDTYTDGYLTGRMTSGYAPAGSYVLQSQDGVLAFYKVQQDNLQKVSAFRAFLSLPDSQVNAVRFYYGDDPTDISSIGEQKSTTALYDISGRQLIRQPQRGLFVSDGKVILVTK